MGNPKLKELELKVLEAYTRDVGRGRVRIDYDSMDSLDISTGHAVEISSKEKQTGAGTLPLYPSDEGKNIIRLDGLTRKNLNVEIGDIIKIKKLEIKSAINVSVIPLEAIPPIDEKYLADALDEIIIKVEDQVMIPYFGGRLSFRIFEVEPKGYVKVTTKTIFKILEGPKSIQLQNIYKLIDEEKQELMKTTANSIKDMSDTKQLFDLISNSKDKIRDLDSLKVLASELITPKETSFNELVPIIEEALTEWLKIQRSRKESKND